MNTQKNTSCNQHNLPVFRKEISGLRFGSSCTHEYNPNASFISYMEFLKERISPYKDKRKFCNIGDFHYYAATVINECLDDMYNGKSGYVFSDAQFREVLKICYQYNLTVRKEDDIIYIRIKEFD